MNIKRKECILIIICVTIDDFSAATSYQIYIDYFCLRSPQSIQRRISEADGRMLDWFIASKHEGTLHATLSQLTKDIINVLRMQNANSSNKRYCSDIILHAQEEKESI